MANKNNKTHMSPGHARLMAYRENNNVTPMTIAIPRRIHQALDMVVASGRHNHTSGARASSLGALVTLACSTWYPTEDVKVLPPLAQFPPAKPNANGRGDRRFTWYADDDLLTNMRVVSARHGCSMRQLIVSAVLEHYKDLPEIEALDVDRGGPPALRMPSTD